MGFDDALERAKNGEDSGSDGSDGSSSSATNKRSSSGGSSYPKYRTKVPYAAVYHTDSTGPNADPDDLTFKQNPQKTCVYEEIKTTENSSWQKTHQGEDFDGRPGHAKMVWMTGDIFDAYRFMVHKHFDVDLIEVLEENPRKGIRLAREAKEEHNEHIGDRELRNGPQATRTCACCEDFIDLGSGDWERVDGLLVHDWHNVKDLIRAGILE